VTIAEERSVCAITNTNVTLTKHSVGSIIVGILAVAAHWYRQAAFVVVSVDEDYFVAANNMEL